jgi:hypothetical protein
MKNTPITLKQLWSAVKCDFSDDDDPVEFCCDSCDLHIAITYEDREVSVCYAVRNVLHRADYERRRIRLQKKYEERVARREAKAKW